MELLLIFNSSILPVFIIAGIAFIYNRLARPDILQIANLTLIIFAPVFVFDAMVKSKITVGELYKPIVFMAVLTTALMVIAGLAGRILRGNENERIALILSGSMINVGNFGLPLIYFSFGKDSATYSALYFIAFSFPLSTVAIYICSQEKKIIRVLTEVLKIPLFHAMILALLFTEFSISVPEAINKSFGLIGQATIPLLIFILGLKLSNIRISFAHIRFIVPAVIIRLVISPVIALILLKTIGISGIEKNVAVIQTSTPAALLPLMYAIRFNRSPDLLAAMIMTTTVLSGLSLTFLLNYLS